MNDVKSQTFSSAVNNKLIVIQRPAHHVKFISGLKSEHFIDKCFLRNCHDDMSQQVDL